MPPQQSSILFWKHLEEKLKVSRWPERPHWAHWVVVSEQVRQELKKRGKRDGNKPIMEHSILEFVREVEM